MSEKGSKSQITDEERLALAAKLDKELDEFIDSLEKRRYTEGWPEDRWQEEMEKHPFFMTKPPEPGDELHPLLEGIQQLKYDTEENTAEDLASNYKEDGNFYIKHKKFKMAILSFTEGLKAKCGNVELNAILYNNRSAAHFFLKNYRSSLEDAQKAMKLKDNYEKAKWRAAQCCFFLKRFDQCLQYCDEILYVDHKNEKAKELQKNCKAKKIEMERDKRKELVEKRQRKEQFYRTVNELKNRNVKFIDMYKNIIISAEEISMEYLKPTLLPLEDVKISADQEGNLIWPIAFSFPEVLVSDCLREVDENARMIDCLDKLFSDPLEWDKQKNYRTETVSIYYEDKIHAKVNKVNVNKTIKEITGEERFYISGGCLMFYIVPKETNIEREFVEAKRKPLQPVL